MQLAETISPTKIATIKLTYIHKALWSKSYQVFLILPCFFLSFVQDNNARSKIIKLKWVKLSNLY